MKTSTPKPFREAMSGLLHDLGLETKLREYEALELWPSIVGEQIAKRSTAERIDNGKMIVHVTSSSWRQELGFLKKELIAKINAAVHQDIVKDIVFR
jgi:predicted nucleic acid-binding Zn ribbon protein